MKKQWYRMMQDGGEIWRGTAYDASNAEEKCFSSFDETPGSLERYTLQRWGVVHYSKTLKGKDWVKVYANQCLASI